jgi:hypothetical protein
MTSRLTFQPRSLLLRSFSPWSGSPVRPEFGNFVLATAAFMIVAMWIFPEAAGNKVSVERKLLAKIREHLS